jgi:hypothetical protein
MFEYAQTWVKNLHNIGEIFVNKLCAATQKGKHTQLPADTAVNKASFEK